MYSRGNMYGSGGSADGYETGAKRQRFLDGDNPYFGASSAFQRPASSTYGYGGGSNSFALFAGSSQALFPVVRIRGLPFNCSDSDVYEFFVGLDIVDILQVRKNGRFSGEAYVVFGAPMQVDFALQRNKQYMGRRYIEVFRCKKDEYYQAITAEVNEQKSENGGPPSPPPSKPSADVDEAEHTGVLKLRGLPYSVSKRDVIEFFCDFKLTDENIHIVTHSDGRTTGEAFVEFSGPAESKAAMKKDKMTIGSRYVELFPSSREEATRTASKTR